MTIKYYSNAGSSPMGDFDNLVRTDDETGITSYIPKDEANSDYAAFLAAGGTVEGPWNPVKSASPEEAWAAYQGQAATALADSNAMVMRCYEAGIPFPKEWADYRTKLRAIAKMTSGDPTQALPTRPADPEGID